MDPSIKLANLAKERDSFSATAHDLLNNYEHQNYLRELVNKTVGPLAKVIEDNLLTISELRIEVA